MDTRAVAAASYRPALQPLFLFKNAARLNKPFAINPTHWDALHVSGLLHLPCAITLGGQNKRNTEGAR